MPTLTQLIQNSQAFAVQQILASNQSLVFKMIDCVTQLPDPLIQNERQCYFYPSKCMDMLCSGTVYRILVQKQVTPGSQEKYTYPFLEYIFSGLKKCAGEDILAGYCNKLLISLVKKTPQIYEYIKDNQNSLTFILKDDDLLSHLRQFLTFLLTESTMELYLFLKSMLIRTLLFRIVQNENTGSITYQSIAIFYEELQKMLKDVPLDEKDELIEVCKNFEEENFITLLILKIDPNQPKRTFHVAKFLFSLCNSNHADLCDLIAVHVDSIVQYFEEYEQSSSFMLMILPDQIMLLRVLCQLACYAKLSENIQAQLLKRLLVYSSVHASNSIIHNMLVNLMVSLQGRGQQDLLNSMNIVSFMMNNSNEQSYGFMSLRRRICQFWIKYGLHQGLPEEEKLFINSIHQQQEAKFNSCKYFQKKVQVEANSIDLSATKMPHHPLIKTNSQSS